MSFAEASTIFRDPLSMVFPDPRTTYDEERFVMIGISRKDDFWSLHIRIAMDAHVSLARDLRPDEKGSFMKMVDDPAFDDDLEAEYDFASLSGGVKGKYVERYNAGTNLVPLAPDVAAAFPTPEAVNEPLRLLLQLAQKTTRLTS